MKTLLIIDGENFKKKISSILKENRVPFSSWELFDFQKLLTAVLKENIPARTIFYGAKIKFYPESVIKSKQLIEEQRHLKTHLIKQGVEVILSGHVRRQEVYSSADEKKTYSFKEKGVDVKIAVDIACLACDKEANIIILGSSDSDLQPAVQEAKKRGVSVTYLGFANNPNKGLMYTCNETILIQDSEIINAYQVSPEPAAE